MLAMDVLNKKQLWQLCDSALFYDSIDTLPPPGNIYNPYFIDVFDGGDYWLYGFLEAPPNSNSWPLSALSSLVYTNGTINSTFVGITAA
jgi:hypothetical protein